MKLANCALAEIMRDEETTNQNLNSAGGTVASESVGSWSRTYATGSAANENLTIIQNRKRDALMLYLAPLGLFKATPVRRCCR